MSALARVRALVREYRLEFGLSRTAVAVEFGLLFIAMLVVAFDGLAFSVVSP